MELLLLWVVCFLNVALVALILWYSRTRAGLYFVGSIIGIFLWTGSIIATLIDGNHERVVFWSRLSFLFPLWIILSFHPFIYALVEGNGHKSLYTPIHKTISWVLAVLGVLFSYLSLTPLVLEDVVNLTSHFGPLQSAYIAFSALSIGYVIHLLAYGWSRSHGQQRGQLSIMLTGIGMSSFLALVTNALLPLLNLGELRSLGPAGLLIFIGCTTYAIIATHLFDIRLIIRRTVVYSGLLAFALGTYSAVIFFFSALLGQNGGEAFEARTFISNLIAAGLIAIGFEPLRTWLQNRTDSFLFKKEYEQQEVLAELSKKLNDVIALDEALEIMMKTIVKTLHLRHAVTFVFQNGENGKPAIKRIKQIGYSSMTKLYLNERDFTISYFSEHPTIITALMLKQQSEENEKHFNYIEGHSVKKIPKEVSAKIREHAIQEAVIKKLESLDSDLAIPLQLNDQPIGLILLSGKLSGDPYTPEDLQLMETIGSQAISVIQKAKLYEGDQMKSEFVSIASHELLTPISAIEGYLSMILDEHMGKVDPQAREYLGKVYSSAKRLSSLVRDLLSVSRIEAGRMKFEQRQLDVTKMITDALDQLRLVAEDKGLTLTFTPPKQPLPPVWADADRVMQVLINLISNGIKYTPKGTVTVSATQITHPIAAIKIEVKDTGLGMSKSAMHHLFEKFYRVATPETTGITGTGLGLYITKSIIEHMGGSISVKSTQGEGSSFSFTLPLFKVETSIESGESKL